MSAKEQRVITPGGLDILGRLLEITDRPTDDKELDFLLERWSKECGEVRYGIIGTNTHGWRSDWALVCLGDEWKGVNGSWMYNRGMRQAYIATIATSGAPETTFKVRAASSPASMPWTAPFVIRMEPTPAAPLEELETHKP